MILSVVQYEVCGMRVPSLLGNAHTSASHSWDRTGEK